MGGVEKSGGVLCKERTRRVRRQPSRSGASDETRRAAREATDGYDGEVSSEVVEL
jgi:hypothetical protein